MKKLGCSTSALYANCIDSGVMKWSRLSPLTHMHLLLKFLSQSLPLFHCCIPPLPHASGCPQVGRCPRSGLCRREVTCQSRVNRTNPFAAGVRPRAPPTASQRSYWLLQDINLRRFYFFTRFCTLTPVGVQAQAHCFSPFPSPPLLDQRSHSTLHLPAVLTVSNSL